MAGVGEACWGQRAWDFMLEHFWPQFSELLLAGSLAVWGSAETGLGCGFFVHIHVCKASWGLGQAVGTGTGLGHASPPALRPELPAASGLVRDGHMWVWPWVCS